MRSRTRFGLGILLTAIAGWVDATGFVSLGGFYVSFMSGNTTQLGIGLSRFDMDLVRLPAILVACFVLGAFLGTLVHAVSGRWNLPTILLIEGILLAFAIAFSLLQIPLVGAAQPLAVAMGAQNAALRSDSGQRIGGTFVTGTVFGLGEKLALWCLRRGGLGPVLRHALGWSALATGAAAGTFGFAASGMLALTVPAGCLLILALATGVATLSAAGAGEERPDQLS
ncbi:MAG: hypothetical protein QOG66_119 [Methylobacteriaceae bacterium]|nr:hypothetical protein [Methylobacteriaceae bacterium]